MTYLLAAGLAWVVAQGLKHVARLMGRNRRIFQKPTRGMLLSGGMPSAHSATVVALATVIGLKDGFDGGLFALAFLFAAVVVYDAVMVRHSSGQQGDLLNRLLGESKSKLLPIKVAHGHTIMEVTVGAGLGLAIAIVVFFTIK